MESGAGTLPQGELPLEIAPEGATVGAMNILEELQWRGLLADCTDAAELAKRVSPGPITLYCGFDPTADSLHAGNLVPLLALRRFQLLGHHPLPLAGGATGSIGDPSGKTQERQLLTKEILASNIAKVKQQLRRLLDFDCAQNPAHLLDNADWTAPVSYLDFLRDIGKHFSVNQMVAKESVRARMEDREAGISYTEFSYMLLQAFDFYMLCRDRNCELQIGGSDQWGNITAGIDLTRKKLGRTVFGLTLPLITNADGTKFGKTAAGAVWLDPARTSVYKFYQFWIRTDDRDVARYLKYFTFLTQEEIAALEKQHAENPGARTAHKALAKAVTDLVHGEEARKAVQAASEALFGVDLINPKVSQKEHLGQSLDSVKAELRQGSEAVAPTAGEPLIGVNPKSSLKRLFEQSPDQVKAELRQSNEAVAPAAGEPLIGVNPKASLKQLFEQSPDQVKAELLFDSIVEDLPHVEIGRMKLEGAGQPLVELLVLAGLCPSKGQARKDVEGGGVYINNQREASFQRAVTIKDLLFGKHLLLRKGKRNYVVLTAK
jgi:tyrosyl-tRNA synthetase